MESITVGGLINQSIATLRGNFTAFFLIAALVSVLSYAILFALGYSDIIYGDVNTDFMTGNVSDLATGIGIASLLSIALYMFAAGAITFGTIQYLNGTPATVGECLSRGLSAAIPLFALGILAGICVGIGFMLLVVPGILLMVVWYVAAPALIVEGVGIFGALTRSVELTDGARWKIFGLIVCVFVLGMAIGWVANFFMLFAGTVGLIVGVAADALLLAFGAVTAAVVYRELRLAKEGASSSELADVFDQE